MVQRFLSEQLDEVGHSVIWRSLRGNAWLREKPRRLPVTLGKLFNFLGVSLGTSRSFSPQCLRSAWSAVDFLVVCG